MIRNRQSIHVSSYLIIFGKAPKISPLHLQQILDGSHSYANHDADRGLRVVMMTECVAVNRHREAACDLVLVYHTPVLVQQIQYSEYYCSLSERAT